MIENLKEHRGAINSLKVNNSNTEYISAVFHLMVVVLYGILLIMFV